MRPPAQGRAALPRRGDRPTGDGPRAGAQGRTPTRRSTTRPSSTATTSLDTFLEIFWLVQELLATPDDWARAAYESLVDAAAHGLRYREMFFTPARHLAAGQDLAGSSTASPRGIEAAESETGTRCMLIADIDHAYGPAAGLRARRELGALRRRRSGRAGHRGGRSTRPSSGVDIRAFAERSRRTARAGFRRTAHAGEAVGVGAANIAIALDVLGAERIDHGVAVMEDPALVQRVARERMPLTVCPNSNIVIANRWERSRTIRSPGCARPACWRRSTPTIRR